MAKLNKKVAARLRRKKSIRKRLSGSAARPRLSVFRSNAHMYAQVIDDVRGVTLVQASTLSPELKEALAGKRKIEQAQLVGKLVAERCLAQSVEAVVFDRNGFIYHGRVKAVADAAREGGLKF